MVYQWIAGHEPWTVYLLTDHNKDDGHSQTHHFNGYRNGGYHVATLGESDSSVNATL